MSDNPPTGFVGAPPALPALGSRVRVVPNHVCPVLNLVDEVAVAHDDRVVGTWRVAARGRNS